MEYCLSGFNGQRPDPVSRHSHLGNGYRAYNPVLGRFTAPDSMSPFGAGGINPYAYCAGDPVNRADPSGHFSLGQGLGMALGLVGGFVLGVLTEGMALPVVVSLLANVAGDAAIGALSELATEAVDGQGINGGMVGMAVGIGAITSLVGFGVGRGMRNAYAATKGNLSRITSCLATHSGYAPEQVAQYDRIALRGLQRGKGLPGGMVDNEHSFADSVEYFAEAYTHTYYGENEIRSIKDSSLFRNKFKPKKWTFIGNFRQENEPVHLSQVIRYQYTQISMKNRFIGQYPGVIKYKNILSPEDISKFSGREGDISHHFFQTENGKAARRILDEFGMESTYVEQKVNSSGGINVIVHTDWE
jgi:RHS repeat-associated protein